MNKNVLVKFPFENVPYSSTYVHWKKNPRPNPFPDRIDILWKLTHCNSIDQSSTTIFIPSSWLPNNPFCPTSTNTNIQIPGREPSRPSPSRASTLSSFWRWTPTSSPSSAVPESEEDSPEAWVPSQWVSSPSWELLSWLLQLTRSLLSSRPTWETWLLSQRWLALWLVSTTVRFSTPLRSSQRWLATTWVSSPSPTPQSDTVRPVTLLPDSSHWDKLSYSNTSIREGTVGPEGY